MSHHRYPYYIRVFWVNNDADDMPSIFQSYIFPGASAIIAAPHAAETFAYIAAHGIFSFAHIYYFFVGRRYGYCADSAAEIFIGNIFPVVACISCFPNATTNGAEVKCVFIFIVAANGCAATAAPGADEAVLHIGIKGRFVWCRSGGYGLL